MAVEDLVTEGLPDQVAESLAGAVGELQRLKISVGTGAAVDTNIAITGIVTTDTVLGGLFLDGAGSDVTDVAAVDDLAVTSAGNVQSPGVDTTGGKVVVFWLDKSA
jgi:hypothetical protein